MSRKELRPEDITAIVDTREQTPWGLAPLQTIRATLTTGDYSIVGLTGVDGIALERKSLGDLLGCIGGSRLRFSEELERMHAYRTKAVIVECSFQEFAAGGWRLGIGPLRSKVDPKAAMGSVLGWIAEGIPFLFCPTPEDASICAARMLFIAARRRFIELGGFYDGLKLSS